MNKTHDYSAIAARELDRVLAIARDRYQFHRPIAVFWDVRGLVGGKARYSDNSIHLNASIAVAEGDAYAQTVAHEVAHLVVYANWTRASFASLKALKAYIRPRPQPHGREWQAVMRAFDREPRRCHSYASAAPVRVTKTVPARCACKQHLITPTRAAKMRAGLLRLSCTLCRTALTLEA